MGLQEKAGKLQENAQHRQLKQKILCSNRGLDTFSLSGEITIHIYH